MAGFRAETPASMLMRSLLDRAQPGNPGPFMNPGQQSILSAEEQAMLRRLLESMGRQKGMKFGLPGV